MGERRGTKGLELWCRRMTEGYPGVNVTNMTTSWRDGLAFCAIIHHFRPDLIEFSKLNKGDVYHNNELAFTIAERHLGIPALLEPEDMVEYTVPDRLSILTYLSQFYQAFAVSQGKSPPSRLAPKRSSSPDGSTVTTASSSPPAKIATASQTRTRREPCAKCSLPVFIAERLNVGKFLYHRQCFRCARCTSQLTLANYYETEAGDFCCETCPDELVPAKPIMQPAEVSTSHPEMPPILPSSGVQLDDAEAQLVLSRSLSDEEKSASLRNTTRVQDAYSAEFEEVLERAQDASLRRNATLSEQMRNEFIASQLDQSFEKNEESSSSSSSELDDVSDVGDEPSGGSLDDNLDNNSVVNSVISVSCAPSGEVSHDDVVTKEAKSVENCSAGVGNSLVKARTRLFEVPSKPTDYISTSRSKENISSSNVSVKTSAVDDEQIMTAEDHEKNKHESISTDEKEEKKANAVIREENYSEMEPVSDELTESMNLEENFEPDSVDTQKQSEVNEIINKNEDELVEGSKCELETYQIVEQSSPVIFKEAMVSQIPEQIVPQIVEHKCDDLQEESEKVNLEDSKMELNLAIVETESSYKESEIEPNVEEEPRKESSNTKKESSTLVETQTEYPEELNPFGDEDSGDETQQKVSTNPFSDDEDDEESSQNVESKTVPVKPTPVQRKKINFKESEKMDKPVEKSGNPFEDSDDDADDEEGESTVERILSDTISTTTLTPFNRQIIGSGGGEKPVPKPRVLPTSVAYSTPISEKSFGGSTSSLASSHSGGLRRKKPAPKPPESGPSSLTSSPSTSVNQSPKSTLVSRKTKRAPLPPIVSPLKTTPTQQVIVNTTSNTEIKTRKESVNDVNLKDESIHDSKGLVGEDTKHEQSSELLCVPNKSTYGKWKRRKGQAPARPIPQKRIIRAPMTEVNNELNIIEIQQQGLEKQGVRLEEMIRAKSEGPDSNPDDSLPPDVEELILQLFELVNEKNELFRRQAELMYLRRQQRLEEEHAEVEYQIRCLMMQPEANKTDSDKAREEELINRLVEIVERRNEIIQCLELDRVRETEEDNSINSKMTMYASKKEDTGSGDRKKEKKKKKQKKEKKLKIKINSKVDADKNEDGSDKSTMKEKKKKKFTIF